MHVGGIRVFFGYAQQRLALAATQVAHIGADYDMLGVDGIVGTVLGHHLCGNTQRSEHTEYLLIEVSNKQCVGNDR